MNPLQLTRRHFLTTAALAASTALRNPVHARTRRPASDENHVNGPVSRRKSNVRTCSVPAIRRGAWPVFFTPFNEDRSINYTALDELVDFYVETEASGIFTACMSSEVFELTFDEILETSRRAVERSQGRLQVVGGLNIGATLKIQARNMDRIRETGVDAVVVFPSLLPSGNDIAGQLAELAELTDTPFGLYECQNPEYRLLSPRDTEVAAKTGRYCFMKDTSCSLEAVTEKLRAAHGSPLRIFPAHIRTTPGCLDRGAAGHCGFVSNVCPELVQTLCSMDDTPERDRLHRALVAVYDLLELNNHPFSGKYILQKRGLRMPLYSRSQPLEAFTQEHRRAIDTFLRTFDFHNPPDYPNVDVTKELEHTG